MQEPLPRRVTSGASRQRVHISRHLVHFAESAALTRSTAGGFSARQAVGTDEIPGKDAAARLPWAFAAEGRAGVSPDPQFFFVKTPLSSCQTRFSLLSVGWELVMTRASKRGVRIVTFELHVGMLEGRS